MESEWVNVYVFDVHIHNIIILKFCGWSVGNESIVSSIVRKWKLKNYISGILDLEIA